MNVNPLVVGVVLALMLFGMGVLVLHLRRRPKHVWWCTKVWSTHGPGGELNRVAAECLDCGRRVDFLYTGCWEEPDGRICDTLTSRWLSRVVRDHDRAPVST